MKKETKKNIFIIVVYNKLNFYQLLFNLFFNKNVISLRINF